VSKWDRLHVHVGADARSVAGLNLRILFATPLKGLTSGAILADSTVWYEDTVSEREFSHATPTTYGGRGFVMSVPVVAPQLYDVILRNDGSQELTTLYVTVMAQEV
jgi:hypothetical protein